MENSSKSIDNLERQYTSNLIEKYQIENKELKRELDKFKKKYYHLLGIKFGKFK